MKLSAPVHELKSRAKKLKKQEQLSLYEAQNRVAQQEGATSWSLLMAKQKDVLPNSIVELLDYLNIGDLALFGSRPQLGKTRIVAGLIAAASFRGGPVSHFFTLVEREETIRERIEGHLDQLGIATSQVNVDCSEGICAQLIIDKLSKFEPDKMQGALVVIDYLQVLDESRQTPPLQNQIESLNLFAKASGCTIVFLAQLSREVEESATKAPDESDIRLPNPLDLGLFNKLLFLHKPAGNRSNTEVRLSIRKPHQHEFGVRLQKGVFALNSATEESLNQSDS